MLKNFRERHPHLCDLLILAAVSALVIFPALGQNRHWASREIRHAEIIREMAESGDYLVPKLLGKTYYDKPPVMHVAAAILIRIVGEPDMILCFSIIVSCLFLCMGMRKHKGLSRSLFFIIAGLLAGLGVVTKGPFGVLFPVFFAILVPFRRQDLKRPRIGWITFGFGVLAAIALWAVPAYFRDSGVYLHKVIFKPNLIVSKGGNGGPFYYVWMVLLLALPLSLFLPVAIVDLRRRGYSAMLAVS